MIHTDIEIPVRFDIKHAVRARVDDWSDADLEAVKRDAEALLARCGGAPW